MFQGAQDFIMKKMLQSKLKDMPPAMQDKIMEAFKNNPDLFKKIAAEIKQKTTQGEGETLAAMQVMRKYQGDLQSLLK